MKTHLHVDIFDNVQLLILQITNNKYLPPQHRTDDASNKNNSNLLTLHINSNSNGD